jgi:hypothetical protein
MNISSEFTAAYAGVNRTVVEFAHSEHNETEYYSDWHSASFYWDKLTAVLVGCSLQESVGSYVGSGFIPYQWENEDFKLVDTNIW